MRDEKQMEKKGTGETEMKTEKQRKAPLERT